MDEVESGVLVAAGDAGGRGTVEVPAAKRQSESGAKKRKSTRPSPIAAPAQVVPAEVIEWSGSDHTNGRPRLDFA